MRLLKLARRHLFVEGQRIFSQGIIESINFRLKQYLQDLNKNVIHVASPHLLTAKGHFPEIHLNEGYAHRPNIGRVAAGSNIFLDKQFCCPLLIGRCLAATLKNAE